MLVLYTVLDTEGRSPGPAPSEREAERADLPVAGLGRRGSPPPGSVCVLFRTQREGLPRPAPSVYRSGHGGKVARPRLSPRGRERADLPRAGLGRRGARPPGSVGERGGARGAAAGGAGEGEGLAPPLPAVPLVLVLVLVLVLLLLLLVLVVVVVVVVAVLGGRGLLAERRQRGCRGRVQTHLQRGLLLTCSLPWELHIPLGLRGGRAVTACGVLGHQSRSRVSWPIFGEPWS